MMPAGVIRPILLPWLSVNQRLPSGPAVMPCGAEPAVGTVKSSDLAGRRHPADAVLQLREPEIAVRARRDLQRKRRHADRVLAVDLGRRLASDDELPELGLLELGEPEVAVGAGRDAVGAAVDGGDEELGDDTGGRDPADLVVVELGEPEVAVGPAVIWKTRPGSGSGNSVTTPAGVIRPILWPLFSVNQRLPSAPATMSSG